MLPNYIWVFSGSKWLCQIIYSCSAVKILHTLYGNKWRLSADKNFLPFVLLQLIPLFVFIGGGCVMCAAYLARLGICSPEVR